MKAVKAINKSNKQKQLLASPPPITTLPLSQYCNTSFFSPYQQHHLPLFVKE